MILAVISFLVSILALYLGLHSAQSGLMWVAWIYSILGVICALVGSHSYRARNKRE